MTEKGVMRLDRKPSWRDRLGPAAQPNGAIRGDGPVVSDPDARPLCRFWRKQLTPARRRDRSCHQFARSGRLEGETFVAALAILRRGLIHRCLLIDFLRLLLTQGAAGRADRRQADCRLKGGPPRKHTSISIRHRRNLPRQND